MTGLWIAGGVVSLVFAAALAEAWSKRNQKRPLSRHAVNKKRFDQDGKAKQLPEYHMIDVPTGKLPKEKTETRKQWLVPRHPEDYAKVMAPKKGERKRK